MKKISVIFGTRPEAIKLAPVILAIKANPNYNCRVCVTAQHRHMLDQVLEIFDISPDVDLDLMEKDQTLAGFTSKAISALDKYLKEDKPDVVVVQGDTATVFCAALAAFYNQIPVAHVEAGLRTGNKFAPWPEEINRVLTSKLADLHFAPTEKSRQNLLREGIEANNIIVTGNTVIDALFIAIGKIKLSPPVIPGLPKELFENIKNKKLILITGHRRENFGEGFESICNAIAQLSIKYPDVEFIYPVHLNPNVQGPVNKILGEGMRQNVYLIPPLTYLPFVALMNYSYLILTDSGGIQEEAPSLGKPVLVMRDVTERPEGVESGTVKLIGTDTQKIVEEISLLLTDHVYYENIANKTNPYGDGLATQRILNFLETVY